MLTLTDWKELGRKYSLEEYRPYDYTQDLLFYKIPGTNFLFIEYKKEGEDIFIRRTCDFIKVAGTDFNGKRSIILYGNRDEKYINPSKSKVSTLIQESIKNYKLFLEQDKLKRITDDFN